MWIVGIYLQILDLFESVYEALGVNYPQLRHIVAVKLTMDNRRTRLTASGEAQIKESNYSFVWTLAIQFLFGCFLLIFLFVSKPLLAFSLVYAMAMFVMSMTLITDFSSVILDSADNLIILPRPVDSRTFLAARNTHIFLYLSSITLALLLPCTLGAGVLFGPLTGFAFAFLGLFSTILVVFLTNLLYLLLMRFTSEERLRNLINSTQIVLVFFMMGGYRLVGRFVNTELLKQSISGSSEWWHYLLPPIWFGHLMDAITSLTFNTEKGIYLGLSVIAPVVVLLALNGSSKLFNSRMAGMDVAQRDTATAAAPHHSGWLGKIAAVVCRNPTEQGAFELVWHLMARDRKFKLRVYPGLFYLLLYFPVFILGGTGNKSLLVEIQDLGQSPGAMVFLLYFCFSSLNTLTQGIKSTEDIKPSWIYTIAPLEEPGRIMAGAFLAILCRFMLPITVILALIGTSIWGIGMLDDLLFALLVVINIELLMAVSQPNHLPFTIEIKEKQGGAFVRGILWLICMSLVGLAHWGMISLSPWFVTALTPLMLVLLVFVFRRYRQLDWSKVYGL